jgi:type I restriction enzyme S subunit
MSGWREASLDELCTRITSGGTPSRKRSDYFCDPPEGHAWVKSQELVDRRITTTSERISDAGLRGSSAKELPVGAVLIAMYGANVGQLGYLGIEATVNQAICALIADPAVADSRFLFYALAESRGDLVTKAHGAAQQNLNQQLIRPYRLRVPELDVQQRIGAVLRAMDDLIEKNRRRIELLEQMARAIYREWFIDFRYPGRGTVELADSALGRIPEGWAIRPFAEVASFANGFAFKPNHWGTEGRPIIKIKQLKEGVTSDTPRCNESLIAPRYWVEPGALLFSWSADLGVYRWAGEPGLLNQHLFRVESSGQLSLSYLFYALDGAMSQFWNRAQGTTMRHIKRSALSEVVVAVPPPEVVDQFSSLVEPMDSSVLVCQRMSRNLESTRDILLFKLVTDQIDVSSFDLMSLVEDSVA